MKGKLVRLASYVKHGFIIAGLGGVLIGWSSESVQASRRTISSLPFTASVNNDTLDLAGTKLTSSGAGILITGQNVVLNLNQDTLVFGSSYGISVENTNSLKVVGGTILKTTTTGSNIQAISIHNSNKLLFSGTNLIVDGHNAHCVEIDGGYSGSYNIEFSGGRWLSNSVSYTSRENYDGAVMYMGSMPANSGNYDVSIHDVTIVNGPGQGIVLRGTSLVYNCNIMLDAYNKYWDTVYSWDQAPIGASWANPYAILARGLEPGAKIYNNTITSGNARYGCRGILMELCGGTRANPIEIYNNIVNIKEGPNKESGNSDGICQVMRIRGEGDSNIYVHDNQFIGTADNNPSTTAVGLETRVFYFNTAGPNSNVIIRNNLIRAATTSAGTVCYGMILEGAGDPSLVFQYNRIESAGEIVKFGGLQGSGRSFTLEKDTISFLSTSLTQRVTFRVGYYSGASNDNRAIDCTYLLGARDTNIVFINSNSDNALKLERMVTVNVVGSNGLPVRDATVRITNNYGKVVTNSNTGSRGQVVTAVPYWFESEDQPDSLNFNPIRITVIKGTDSVMSTVTLSATATVAPNMALVATLGLPVSGNLPPTMPVPLSPLNGTSLTGTPVRLTVLNSIDANNDAVRYDFWISANASFTQIVDSIKNLPAGYLQTQATFTNFIPVTGGTYWWRARSTDGIDWTSTTTSQSFTYQCSASANVQSLTALISFILARGPMPPRGDFNGDNRTNINDIVFLVNYLFNGGSSPSCN